jgi:hypothetical protein
MKVTEVTVSGGYTISHPYQQYSNLRCDVSLRVVIEEGDDLETVLEAARYKVDAQLDVQKNRTLAQLKHEYERRFEPADDGDEEDPAITDEDGEQAA